VNDIDLSYKGAGRVDPIEMKRLLDNMEREGNLTPISIYRRFQELDAALKTLTQRMLREEHPSAESLKELSSYRDELRSYLANENAEYYDAFKAKYDWCQVILGLKDNVRFNEYLELMIKRGQGREPRTTSSFFEIRYTN